MVITHSVLNKDSTLVKSKATITTERKRGGGERDRERERSILILGVRDISFTSWELDQTYCELP